MAASEGSVGDSSMAHLSGSGVSGSTRRIDVGPYETQIQEEGNRVDVLMMRLRATFAAFLCLSTVSCFGL